MAQGKNWCFTINADEEAGEHIIWQTPGIGCPLSWFTAGDIDYMVCQIERVAHVHIQGYIQFKTNKRLTALKKLSQVAHWELRRGTHTEARDYCKKADSRVNGPWEFGTERDNQGKRSDLEAIGALVKAKKTDYEIVEELGASASRFSKQINFLRFTYNEKESDRQLQGVKVLVLYGPTGTGKTYAAVNAIAGGLDYYIAEAPSKRGDKLWFDGYTGQRTLILDDFDGEYCTLAYLKRLLDCYKLKIEIKGGHAWAVWTTVIITSNMHPSGWYTKCDTTPLKRRLTERGSEIRLVEHQGTYKRVSWDEHVLDADYVNFQVPPTPAASQTPATQHTDGDDPDLVILL